MNVIVPVVATDRGSRRSRPAPAESASISSRTEPTGASGKDLAERLVLIVDDYADTRMLYVEHLRDAGFRVVEATDGEEAVRMALTLHPDAIIMDLSMPKLDGWDATRRIRADENMKDTYIVALSAMDGEISREMAFDAGCNDFIAKPFLAAALVQVLVLHFRDETPAGS
jgi:two-component system cell cycle response regulator DivK